jgi:hypothetical protein
VHNIVLNSNGGSGEDLTTAAAAPMVAQTCSGLPLTSFTRSTASRVESEVCYIASDQNVHRLSQTAVETVIQLGLWKQVIWRITGWTDVRLNLLASMPSLNRCAYN